MPGRTFIALAGAILLMILAGGSVATFGDALVEGEEALEVGLRRIGAELLGSKGR